MEIGDKSDDITKEKGSGQTAEGPKVSECEGGMKTDSGAAGGLNEKRGTVTAGKMKENQEQTAAASVIVDGATGDSQEKGDEAAGHLSVKHGSGTTDEPMEKDGGGATGGSKGQVHQAAGASTEEGSSAPAAVLNKKGPQATDGSKQDGGGGPNKKKKQKGGASGDAAKQTEQDGNGSKMDHSKEITTTARPEESVVVKLHAFIQPGAWDVDIKKNPHVVELRSDMSWNQNCAEIKLT